METTSPGLLQDGTRNLETEGGRTNSRATAPETERASATTDSWSIARVAPAATAGGGSTGKPGAALGERAVDDACQAARCHRPEAPHQLVPAQTDPAVKAVSLLPQNGAAGQVNVVQSAAQGVTGSAGTTPKVVNIVPAPTHSISLQYSFNGIVSSSSPVFTSTLMSSTTGPVVAPDPEAASSESTGMEPPAVAIAAAGARLTTHVEVAAPGVSVGPLVTRGSAPLRPPLGTTPGEPTPSIDRNERTFDLAALGSGAEVDAELLLGLTTNRSDGNGEDTPVNPATRTTEPLIALRGPGGLPVMVELGAGGSVFHRPCRRAGDPPGPKKSAGPRPAARKVACSSTARCPRCTPARRRGGLHRLPQGRMRLDAGDRPHDRSTLPRPHGAGPQFSAATGISGKRTRRSGARRKGLLRGFRRWLGLC